MKNKKIIIIIALLILVGGALAWRYAKLGPSEDEQETQIKNQISCAQDVRECRNGTFVHRVAPSCGFQKCPDGSEPPSGTPVFEDGTVPDASTSISGSSSAR